MLARTSIWIAASFGLAACGSDDSQALPKPGLDQCSDGWDTLASFQVLPGYAPKVLRWHNGSLYYQDWHESPSRFMALPDSGGTPTELSRESGRDFWIEDDKILYATVDQLHAVPIAGGSSSVISDGGTFGDALYMGQHVTFWTYALDESSLFWVLRDADPEWSVWRAPREGGSSEKLGGLPDSLENLEALVALPEQLLVAGNRGDTYLLPKEGGEAQALPTISSKRSQVMWSTFLGAAPSGALWEVEKQNKLGADTVLVTPDGHLVDVWPSKPADHALDHAWSDERGGWVVTGLEPFSDGDNHTSLWLVDANHRATRLACDARAGHASGYPIAAALSPDAVYIVVMYFESLENEGDQGGWALIKIPR